MNGVNKSLFGKGITLYGLRPVIKHRLLSTGQDYSLGPPTENIEVLTYTDQTISRYQSCNLYMQSSKNIQKEKLKRSPRSPLL